MKKVLLGTSAIALAGAFASQAAAAEWEVRVGGYMEQSVAYANTDPGGAFAGNDFDGFDTAQDAEIFFLPSITLDNGLKIGANIQLEGNTSGDQIDESYMYIKGSWGTIEIGSENSAGYKMMYAAPDVTFINVNSGSMLVFIPISGTAGAANVFRGTLGSSFIEVNGNNDIHRLTYYTPRFAGFQVGVSYSRDAVEDASTWTNCNGTTCDFFDIGANFVQSFNGIDIAISGRYGTADNPGGANPDVWAVGANIGFMGFTIGGSYAETDDMGNANGRFWDAGISYETGPWGFSFTYANGRNVNNEAAPAHETLEQYLLGVSYKLAKGVTLGAFGGYVDFEENGEFTPEDTDGWVVGTGIKISF